MSDLVMRLRAEDTPDNSAADPALCGEAADEVERLRGLITEVVDQMQTDDGEVVHVCAEPERADDPECLRQSDGFAFDLLRPAFNFGLWADLLDVYEEST